MRRQRFVIKIESYEGTDTFLHRGDDTQDFLFAIAVLVDGSLTIVDNGYRTQTEALEAWPEANSIAEETS